MVSSNWKMWMGFAALAVGLVSHEALAACTGGPGWTHEEYEEYLTLNDTTGWPGLAKLKQCTIEDLLEEQALSVRGEDLEARSGQRQWQGFSSGGCSGAATSVISGFGCGVCVNAASFFFYSGWLWREGTGNPYPTADYFTSGGCSGSVLHHQGILSGQHTSCDNVNRAASVILYQGC